MSVDDCKLEDLSESALKEKCKEAALKLAGAPEVLIARLKKHMAGEDDLDDYTQDGLKQKCKERQLKQTGSTFELEARLVENAGIDNIVVHLLKKFRRWPAMEGPIYDVAAYQKNCGKGGMETGVQAMMHYFAMEQLGRRSFREPQYPKCGPKCGKKFDFVFICKEGDSKTLPQGIAVELKVETGVAECMWNKVRVDFDKLLQGFGNKRQVLAVTHEDEDEDEKVTRYKEQVEIVHVAAIGLVWGSNTWEHAKDSMTSFEDSQYENDEYKHKGHILSRNKVPDSLILRDTNTLPFLLQPGDRWAAIVMQNTLAESTD